MIYITRKGQEKKRKKEKDTDFYLILSLREGGEESKK